MPIPFLIVPAVIAAMAAMRVAAGRGHADAWSGRPGGLRIVEPVRYTCANAAQRRWIERVWRRRMDAMAAERRAFEMPGGPPSADDRETWRQYAAGIPMREHVMFMEPGTRVSRIAFEFASGGACARFLGNVPDDGPRPRRHVEVEGLELQAMTR